MSFNYVQPKPLLDKQTGEIFLTKYHKGKIIKDVSESDARLCNCSNRFKLQNASASILKKERVSKCLNVNISSSVDLHKTSHSGGKSSVHFSGLMQCGSVWHCPVCSSKISQFRADELRTAFQKAKEKNLHVSHVTFTFPHQRGDCLQSNLDKFLDAFKKFWDSSPMRTFKKGSGLVGRVRALEVTYSDKNGWHPHIHLLLFTESKLNDLDSLSSYFLKVWNDKLSRVGLNLANVNGIKIQNGDKAGEYITKFADDQKIEPVKTSKGEQVTWDLADEMTKLNSKQGRLKSLTPFDLLRVIDNPLLYGFSSSDLPRFKSLFFEYAKAFKGKSQLDWGRGSLNLRKNLGMTQDLSDKEVVELEEEQTVISTIHLPLAAWRRIRRDTKKGTDSRALLKSFFEIHGKDETYKFIKNAFFRDLSQKRFDSQIVNYKPSS